MIAHRRCFLLLYLFLLWAPALFAYTEGAVRFAPPEPVYRNINTDQGLPSSETYDILQDKAGYVWIATDRGVARYDGYRMRVFTKKDGLSDDVVFKLYEDPRGRVWFLTYNGQLSYYKGGKIVPYRYNKKIREYSGKVTALFKSIIVDDQDNLYYAIHYNGMIRIDAKGKMTVLHPETEPDLYIQRYAGHWIASSFGASGLKLKRRRNIPHNRVMMQNAAGKWERVIFDYMINTGFGLSESGRNAFLFADSIVFDINRRKTLFVEGPVIGIDCIGNELFTGIYKRGVRCDNLAVPEGHPLRTRYLLSSYSVSGVMRDREGGYWFTTLEKGVFYAPSLSVNVYDHRQGLVDLESCSITGIRGRVFISHGFRCTDMGPPVTQYNFSASVRMSNYSAANGQKVLMPWPGTERVKVTPTIIFGPTFRDAYAKDDYFLTCIYKTWRIYNDGRYEVLYNHYEDSYLYENPNLSFEAIVETDDRRIFMGSPNGLYELRNKHLLPLKGSALFRERTSDLALHPKLGMIVGTRGKGVYVLDEKLKVGQVIDLRSGLPSDLVTCLYVSEEGDVYVGTSEGMAVFAVRNGKLVRKFMLTTAQGLSTNEIRSIYAYQRTAWIATKTGLAVIDLDHLPERPPLRIYLESVTCGNETYEDCRVPALLPTDVGAVRITLRTDNFRGTRRHRFRYRLRDEAKWQISSEPEIQLNEPRWGDYRIVVQFLDDCGEWSAPKELLRFTVETPYYSTWYFILGLVLLGTGTIYLLFRARISQINRRNNLRETINKLEQKALRAQMNPHFIFNSLNSIQSFLIYDENEKAEKYLLRFARLIRQTLNNSRESYIPIDVELETLRSYLELEQMRFKEKFVFEMTCHLSQSELAHGIPPMLIQPFVENAVLHGFKTMETGGVIEVRFEKLENQRLLCIVEDNGVGRKATMQAKPEGHKSFGTKITAERLAAFQQKYGDHFTIEVIDKEANGRPAGTRVVLQIPVVTPNELLVLQETEE